MPELPEIYFLLARSKPRIMKCNLFGLLDLCTQPGFTLYFPFSYS